MIESIIEAIAVALNVEFGDGLKIYTEEKRQGLEEPCFFISCINPAHNLFMGRRYFRENMFVVQYFPKDELNPRRECNEVADRLYLCLEWLTVTGDLVMGSKMHYEVADGVLQFFVNYNLFVIKTKTDTMMEDLTLTQLEKKGGKDG